MEEMEKGLWLFGLESPNEARRILREGTRRLGGFSISLRKWGKDVRCNVGSNIGKTVWVRLSSFKTMLAAAPLEPSSFKTNR